MGTINFAVKAEGFVQVVDNRFPNCAGGRIVKAAPRILDLRGPRADLLLGESAIARTHKHIKWRIDSLTRAAESYLENIASSRNPSGFYSPATRFWTVKPNLVKMLPEHLHDYEQALDLVPFELESPMFLESSTVGYHEIHNVFAHLDVSYCLLTPTPCGLHVEVGIGSMSIERLRPLAALTLAAGRLISQIQPDQRRNHGTCLNSRFYSRVATGYTAEWACERVREIAAHSEDPCFHEDVFPLPLPIIPVPLPPAAKLYPSTS